MAGQTLVHRTVHSATEGYGSQDKASSPLLPVKIPFKKKRRRLWWLMVSKCIVAMVCLVGLDFLAGTHLIDSPQVELPTKSNTTKTKAQTESSQRQLDLRPSYLTDDRKTISVISEDEGDDDELDDKVTQYEVIGPHKIPRTLIFTHYKNLLELETNHSNRKNLTANELEEFTLATNVRHSIDIHKEYLADQKLQVLFWTDQDCIESLERTRPKLIPYFKAEKEGMYKADICRGTALLEHGGFYLDVDVGVRHDLWRDLKENTEFVTARVHSASNWVGKGFFQAILGAKAHSPVLERYLELFEKHYDGSDRVQKGPLGVLLLYRAWNEVSTSENIPTELYQELLFHPNGPLDKGENKGVLSPAPTWGKRRACHFVVAGFANDEINAEIHLGDKGLQIPALSRIPGSRMCVDGENDNTLNATRMIESMKWWERT